MIEIALLVLFVASVVVAIAVPKFRKAAIGAALVVAGLFGGKKLFGGKDDDEPDEIEEDRPKPELVDDPIAPIEEELHDAHDDIDSLDSDDLDDAWAEHADSAAEPDD